jgi:hypothetical protein
MAARQRAIQILQQTSGLETKFLLLLVLPLLQNAPFANSSNCSAESKRKLKREFGVKGWYVALAGTDQPSGKHPVGRSAISL